MTNACINYYTKVRKFTLVQETPKGLRVRLEDHPRKISIWMGKKITRDYTGTSAWFWSVAFDNNVGKEEQKLRDQREDMQSSFQDFNDAHVVKPTNGEVKKIETIHNWNPNKQVYNNSRRKK